MEVRARFGEAFEAGVDLVDRALGVFAPLCFVVVFVVTRDVYYEFELVVDCVDESFVCFEIFVGPYDTYVAEEAEDGGGWDYEVEVVGSEFQM